ncbi:MAG: hypothetical protein R3C14_04145 [Caldilineaceae bacterium]
MTVKFVTIWQQCQQGLHRFADLQARLLLTLLYLIFVAPVGFFWRLAEDPLVVRRTKAASYWRARPALATDLRRAKRQG